MLSATMIPEPFIHTESLYFVLINADGYYSVANSCFLKKTGLSEAALTSVHSFETILPADRSTCLKAVEFLSYTLIPKVPLKQLNGKKIIHFWRICFLQIQPNRNKRPMRAGKPEMAR
mgnify:CR=1 FL=1